MTTKKDLSSVANKKETELDNEQVSTHQQKDSLIFVNFKKVRKTKKGGLLIVLDDNKAVHIHANYFKKVIGG
jgi:hypothetical protein